MSDSADRLYERVLVVRCQTGDQAALSELIARYSPRVRFFLKKMAGEAAADDLLQDVWIDVFGKIARLREPAAFSAWVYRIARDKAYAQFSGRRTVFVPINEDVAGEVSVADDEWSAEDVARVRVALDELAAEHREVLLLRFVEDMSYDQIGDVIERPVGTVRSRIHYAKCALREVMGKRSTERMNDHAGKRSR
jgi:RNA polymerase sigma-70 factor (ECF subfamily)